MNKKTKPTKRTSHQKTAAKCVRKLPDRGYSLPKFIETLRELGIHETEILSVLRKMGYLYDEPGMPWDNLPTPMSIENGLMALLPVGDQVDGTSGLNHDMDTPVEQPFQGRTGLRIEGGTAGELLHAWHLYQEQTSEGFID